MRVPKLSIDDLPHLEDAVRSSGTDPRAYRQRSQDGVWTEFSLMRAAWAGRGGVILSSGWSAESWLTAALALEGFHTAFSYVQIACMHELIIAQDTKSSDRSYAVLMCWGLLLGQVVDVLLGAFIWCVLSVASLMPGSGKTISSTYPPK